jgi:hypothetical protein
MKFFAWIHTYTNCTVGVEGAMLMIYDSYNVMRNQFLIIDFTKFDIPKYSW